MNTFIVDMTLPNHVPALQCRLHCHPGYVSARTPIVTCVDGSFEPHHPSTYCCQPSAALLAFSDGSLEIFSKLTKCNQVILKYSNFSTSGQTIDLLDDQLILVGDKKLGGKFKYFSIHSPRENMLAVKYSRETSSIKGSPYGHTSYVQGNKLTLLGGVQSSHATLNTDIWTKLNLRWLNQTLFSAFTSGACQVKLTRNEFVLMGGVTNVLSQKTAVNTVVKINLDEETVEEMPPMNLSRVHHSCQTLKGEDVILISGGIGTRPTPTVNSLTIQEDEIYNLTINTEPKVLIQAHSLGRYQHKLLRLGDSVFAVGGKDNTTVLPSAIRVFNAVLQVWEDSRELLKSNDTGEVAVTPFPLTAVDCVEGCKCGGAASGPALSRVVGGDDTKVNWSMFQSLQCLIHQANYWPWVAAVLRNDDANYTGKINSQCGATLV